MSIEARPAGAGQVFLAAPVGPRARRAERGAIEGGLIDRAVQPLGGG